LKASNLCLTDKNQWGRLDHLISLKGDIIQPLPDMARQLRGTVNLRTVNLPLEAAHPNGGHGMVRLQAVRAVCRNRPVEEHAPTASAPSEETIAPAPTATRNFDRKPHLSLFFVFARGLDQARPAPFFDLPLTFTMEASVSCGAWLALDGQRQMLTFGIFQKHIKTKPFSRFPNPKNLRHSNPKPKKQPRTSPEQKRLPYRGT
jgi:hypothetical protein